MIPALVGAFSIWGTMLTARVMLFPSPKEAISFLCQNSPVCSTLGSVGVWVEGEGAFWSGEV